MTYRVLIAAAVLVILIGCQPNTEPIERTASKGFDVVNTTLAKAVSETSTRSAALQGQLSGVEPGWVVEGYGILGTGVVYQGKVYMKGVSGTLMGHAQTDQGEALPDQRPPGDRVPVTQPAKPTEPVLQ